MINFDKEMIDKQEKFVPIGTKTLDSKNRISLGNKIKKALLDKMKVDGFQVFVGEEGDILLKPVASIPSKEAWLYKNKAALKLVKQGLDEAKQGKLEKVVNLEDFIKKL